MNSNLLYLLIKKNEKMKKTILKIAAVALLVGGLAFNITINKTSNNNMLTSLKTISGISVAQAETTANCDNGCLACGDGCLCGSFYPTLLEGPSS